MLQQQEKQKQLEAKSPDVHLLPSALKTPLDFPEEHPCFVIDNVKITGRERLPDWVPLQRLANRAVGRCLGVNGINQLVSAIQNRLIGHGWITTRALVPAQDLSTGTLQLAVLPGNVQSIHFTEKLDHYSSLYTTLPTHSGDVLDLRSIEQGLENLQRLPTVKATVEMLPGEGPGDTNIIIDRHQSRIWRLGAWVDNSGTASTGKHQAGIMVALDNPLALSDLFYLTTTRDTGFRNSKNTANYSAHYSVPFGYWQFAATGSDYEYVQTVAGNYNDIQYRGKNKSLNLQLSHVLYRNARAKTSASYDVYIRETRNFIADAEIKGQKRRTSAWKVALNHRHYVGQCVLTAGASYHQGTRWFGALAANEEFHTQDSESYATALAQVMQFSAAFSLPFNLANQRLRFDTQYLRQTSNTPLTPQDQFSIGNRWTVRGFDGERMLSGDKGWSLRNTLSWTTPMPNQEIYLGADYGEITGRGNNQNLGRHLAGGALGLRGAIAPTNLSYDVSIETPFSKPDGFKTDSTTVAFSVNWNY